MFSSFSKVVSGHTVSSRSSSNGMLEMAIVDPSAILAKYGGLLTGTRAPYGRKNMLDSQTADRQIC